MMTDSHAKKSSNLLDTMNICFYGAGSMAEAIARGLVERNLLPASNIGMINRQNASRLAELRERYGVHAPQREDDKKRLLREADVIFLAMKPKDAEAAIRELGTFASENQLIVSVIAGLSIRTVETLLGKPLAIIRTMPNTSSTIGLGATGISFSAAVSGQQRAIAETIFQSVGVTATVEEPLIDAITGVSGSGPAYVYYLMEAMIEGGISLGLSPEDARELTVQTVLGAASMVRATGEQPAELRRKVTSPGGTTQAAIEMLDSRHTADAIVSAVKRAAERAGELGAAIERSATE
jgi:pyrroline-5-carboxylate reductase